MKIKLIRITTVPTSLHSLIKGQPNFMQKHSFEVQLLSSEGEEIPFIKEDTGIVVKTFPYTRTISPLTDLKALWLTYKYFRKEKPKIVHTHTPKAGVVGMLAAKLSGIPIRMHTVAGLPLMEATGIKRKVLNFVERLTSWSATNVYPNSNALREFMEKEGLAPRSKLTDIGNGSSNGINTEFFSKRHLEQSATKSKDMLEDRKNSSNTQRSAHNDGVTFCFVGRIVKDKGINELLSAFNKLSAKYANAKLLLVGGEERELDPISKQSQEIIESNKHVISIGFQKDVRPFLAASDVFVFPSYREGFPNVVMQAGALELPSIVTNINGSNEIIEDGVNGIIIPVKDEQAIYDKMKLLYNNKGLRDKLAKNSRKMIIDRYDQKFVWEELLKEYNRLLGLVKK